MNNDLKLIDKEVLINIIETQNETIAFLAKELKKTQKLYTDELDKRENFIKKTIKEMDEILKIV